MTISLTTSLASTITKSELEGNFTTIANKFNAGIDNTDIKTGAGIAISKIAATKEYCVVTLESRGDATGLTVGNQYRDEVPFPGLSGTEAAWSLKSASWVCTDVGAASTSTFDIEWCEYADAGTRTVITTPINAEVLTKGSGAITNSRQCTIDAATIAFSAAQSRVFALKIETLLATAMDDTDTPASPSYLKVSLLLERDIQA